MSEKQENPRFYKMKSTNYAHSQMHSQSQIIGNIVIEANQNTQKDNTNQNKQHVIGVSLKKAKTATERSREFRARKRLLDQEKSKQQQQQLQVGSGALISERRQTSAERTRRWRERKGLVSKRIQGKSKPKSAAERSREYRQRKKNRGRQTHAHLANFSSTSNRESQYIKLEPVDHDSNQTIDSTQENYNLMGVLKEEVVLSDDPFDEAETVHSNVDFMSLADSSVPTDIVNYTESKFTVGFRQSDHDEDIKQTLSDNHFLKDASNREYSEPKGTDNSKRKSDSENELNISTKNQCHVLDFGLLRREDFKEEATWHRFVNVLGGIHRENLLLKLDNAYLRDKIATLMENGKEVKWE